MGRFLLLVVGAVLGAMGLRRLQRLVQALSPSRDPRPGASWTDSVKDFAAEVSAGMAEREAQLRAALGVEEQTADLDPGQAHELLEHPTSPGR